MKYNNMQSYCTDLKSQIVFYNQTNNVDLYGDQFENLKNIIKNFDGNEQKFAVLVGELSGIVTRVIQGYNPGIPFIEWVGSKSETFDYNNFTTTMKTIWPELF